MRGSGAALQSSAGSEKREIMGVERPWVAVSNALDAAVGEAREPSSKLPTVAKQGDRTTTQE